MSKQLVRKSLLPGLVGLGLVLLSAHRAEAQLQRGDPRQIYPGADLLTRPKPAPNPSFTHGARVLPGGGYGYEAYVVNGYPCNVPSYYLGYSRSAGVSGYYAGGYSVGVNLGGL